MAGIDDELMLDEQETQRELAFVHDWLPSELKERYTDEQLRWMLDTIVDYYVESGILDTDDDEVDIDLEQVAQHLCDEARRQGQPALEPAEVFFVVEADLEFQEQAV